MLHVDWSILDGLWGTQPEVLAVWAFGSARHGSVREGGDVDLGVLFECKPSCKRTEERLAAVPGIWRNGGGS